MEEIHPITRNGWWNALVVACFAVLLIATRPPGGGVDLTSSYLGCRLFINGQTSHLYSQDTVSYQLVNDPVWKQATLGRGFAPGMALPPYVQTPLWGYALQPLCRSTEWPAFNEIFVVLLAFSFAAMLWMAARFWTPRLFHPGWLAAVCAVLFIMEPLQYSMALTQTHILFIFMALVAVVVERRGHWAAAGLLLALAAAVKITPGLLLLYWLMNRRWKAAASFLVSSAALLAITIVATGRGTVLAWLASMSRVSKMLLVAWNNQSLAGWLMGGHYPEAELWTWHIFPLPPTVKALSLGLLIASAIAGGYIDWRLHARDASQPPYGAILTLTGATMFTPIAWSHYSVLLIVPVMMLLDAHLRRRSRALFAAAVSIVLLNVYFFFHLHQARLGIHLPYLVRVQFYAGVLALAALVALYRRGMVDAASLYERTYD